MSVWLWSPTFIISSFVSFSAILLAISCMKASRLSRPELSLSTWEGRLVCKKTIKRFPPTSETIFLISSFLGSNPRALMATFKSLESITPWPAVSKRLQQGGVFNEDSSSPNISKKTTISPESLLDVWLLLLSEIKFGRHSFSLCTSRHVWKQFNHDGWRYMEGELTYRPCITGCLTNNNFHSFCKQQIQDIRILYKVCRFSRQDNISQVVHTLVNHLQRDKTRPWSEKSS